MRAAALFAHVLAGERPRGNLVHFACEACGHAQTHFVLVQDSRGALPCAGCGHPRDIRSVRPPT